MKLGRTTALVAALGVTVGLLAACSNSLSQTDVQDKLAQGLSDQLGGEYTVTCPADLPLQAGATFTCDAVAADGTTGMITVTEDDDQGNITWEYTATS